MADEPRTGETQLLNPVAGVTHEALRLENERLRETNERIRQRWVEERAAVKVLVLIVEELAAGTSPPRHLRKIAKRALKQVGSRSNTRPRRIR